MDGDNNNQTPAPKSSGGGKAITTIVVIIILALAAWYGFSHFSGSSSSEYGSTATTTSTAGNTQGTGTSQTESLKDLMASGVAQTCTVNYTNGSTQSQAQIYVSGGKMRSSAAATVSGAQVTMNMINDGQNIYTWMDGQSTGYKMSASV